MAVLPKPSPHVQAVSAPPVSSSSVPTDATSRVSPRSPAVLSRVRAAAVVLTGAFGLWLTAGVGFVNYDTLYSLVWGQQLVHGEAPAYRLTLAPTPHPLLELLGVLLAPLGAGAATAVTVGLAFLALSACGWTLYRLGAHWFGRATGAVAAVVLLTRVPILSYGVRAYADIPFVLFVLLALLIETRRPCAGAPVLGLLAMAGLLRPEAWGLSAAYWLYLALVPRLRSHSSRSTRSLALLALLAFSAPVAWLASDLLITGNPLWSLLNTRSTAHQLNRVTGIANVPEYIPRRIGEILRPAVLAGAALGGVLSLAWLGPRARLGAAAGVLAVAVLATSAAFGLPIDTRYAFLAAAILCVFCGAGTFGWMALPAHHPHKRAWTVLGTLALLGILASLPGQLKAAHRELSVLSRQQRIQDDLVALTGSGSLSRCGPVEVPSHAPIPLLALYLGVAPSRVVYSATQPAPPEAPSNQDEGTALAERKPETQHTPLGTQPIQYGSYLQPASLQVEREYVLNAPAHPQPASIPPGFQEAHANSSWLLFEHCAA